MLVIAHRLELAYDADQIVVLDGGRAVQTGSHLGLLARDGLYDRLAATYEVTRSDRRKQGRAMSTTVRLIRLMAPFRWWIALAVLLSFATIGSSVGLMAMSAYLISKAAVATSVIDLTLTITWRALLCHRPGGLTLRRALRHP